VASDAGYFFGILTVIQVIDLGREYPPAFPRNQYGGAVGGPIRKDKTFFFTNYEKLGEVKSLSSNDPTLSANAHNGILCANTACTSTTQIAINQKVLRHAVPLSRSFLPA